MTTSNQYGSVDHFQTVFADILAEVGTGIPERDAEIAVNMLEGFEKAIMDWMTYHEECIKSYRDLHARFLGIDR